MRSGPCSCEDFLSKTSDTFMWASCNVPVLQLVSAFQRHTAHGVI